MRNTAATHNESTNDRNVVLITAASQGIGRAIEKDHGYALAYAGLADAYWWLTASQPPKLVMPKAKVAALKALELDGSLAEAHVALGLVQMAFGTWTHLPRNSR